MTTTSGRIPMVTRADWIPGPGQGRWTYRDYAALPDDGHRYEIVNGVLYMAPAPSWSHQEIVGAFYRYLYTYVTSSDLGGVFIAPIDVELAPNVVFQPDVVVLLKESRDKLKERHIVGAPDLVVEVVSPGSATHDRYKKLEAYARAGVPEYWIADPDAQTVEVLTFGIGDYHSQGVFQGKATLPSRILPSLATKVEEFFVSAWK